MVQYTQFSPYTIYTERTELWDPTKILEIINPDKGCLTCVGDAPSKKRRCRNPIKEDNRALITTTLDEVARLRPDNPAVMSKLRSIVGPALCVTYHQPQAERVAMNWQSKIQMLKTQIGERKPAKPVQSGRLQEPARDQNVEDLKRQVEEMRMAMAKLRQEIDSQRHQSQERQGSEERAAEDRRQEQEVRIHQRSEERIREARRMESERLEKERLEKVRLEKERVEKERLERARLERSRLEKERVEKERLERARLEKARLEKARFKKERLEQEHLERERLAKDQRENEQQRQEKAAANEQIRQRAQERREEREQREREKKEKERAEWDQLWVKYQERWARLKASASEIGVGNIRDIIPWPVKSGSYLDAEDEKNIEVFFQSAASRDKDMVQLMRKECLKWHPDSRRTWLRDARLSDDDKTRVDRVCRVVTELLNKSAGRSSDFFV